jgi:hypothetical protein
LRSLFTYAIAIRFYDRSIWIKVNYFYFFLVFYFQVLVPPNHLMACSVHLILMSKYLNINQISIGFKSKKTKYWRLQVTTLIQWICTKQIKFFVVCFFMVLHYSRPIKNEIVLCYFIIVLIWTI